LQDQAVAYGCSRGRYKDEKRAVEEKELGPLIKTAMTRCIHCTRCVRFANEICGTPELGGMFRGEKLEIGPFIARALTSELSGNLIDLCPTGALTSKPGSYAARSWEYQKTESIDVLDGIGSNIRVDVRGNEVMRVLPRQNDAINEEWINDKTRFAVDGLKYRRLDKPYIRENGRLVPASWQDAFTCIADKIRDTASTKVAAIAGNLADCEAMFALKSLLTMIGSPHMDCRQDEAEYDISTRAAYIMNSGIAGIDEADAILLIGTNPRHEGTLINARIRRRWLQGGCRVGMVGVPVDLGYPYKYIGDNPQCLTALINGEGDFARILAEAKKPMFIVGAGALARPDGSVLHRYVKELAEHFNAIREDWNGFNVLQHAASRVGGLDLGFLPQAGGFSTRSILNGQMHVIWLLGADEANLSRIDNAFVIYQGHHGDVGAERADVILPGAAYTEKTGIYVNTEGRSQMALQATFPPGDAREDWKIIRALSDIMGSPLPFDTLAELREQMIATTPSLENLGQIEKAEWLTFGFPGSVSKTPFAPVIDNFYMTDSISRASPTMAMCTDEILPLLKKEASA